MQRAIRRDGPVHAPDRQIGLEIIENAVHAQAEFLGIAGNRRVQLIERRAEALLQRPERGEAQHRRDEPIAVRSAPHQDQIFLNEPRRRDQRRVIARLDQPIERTDTDGIPTRS